MRPRRHPVEKTLGPEHPSKRVGWTLGACGDASSAKETDTAGHRGQAVMKAQARHRFFWPSMDKDIEAYVSDCPQCAESKARPHKHWGPRRATMPPVSPFTHYSLI